LDKTPVARVIARCTEDIQTVDDTVANEINQVVQITIMMLIRLGAVMIFTPVFILPCVALIRSIASANVTFRGVLIAVLGGFVGQLYMKAQLSVKREMSNAICSFSTSIPQSQSLGSSVWRMLAGPHRLTFL
jgi:ABC-type multidrug transport system fused ATPase/permease subunit